MKKSKLNSEQGKRLRECLIEKNMFQKELAKKAGYTPQYISNIVSCKKPLSLESARCFSKILGVTEEYLLCESDYKTEKELNTAIAKKIEELDSMFLEYMAFNTIKVDVINDNNKSILDELAKNEVLIGSEYLVNTIRYKNVPFSSRMIKELQSDINSYIQFYANNYIRKYLERAGVLEKHELIQ